ncbi:hypothetical protein OUZ56_033047 [Daphnia magna]|uniref:Transmembrane protein n=1 Tax=Daphnia magna TaxID=35525 RepID=A0ABR0BA27_9CRUS|nr:hypothetical protein OUZ56_033047 [Daphnia magna]
MKGYRPICLLKKLFLWFKLHNMSADIKLAVAPVSTKAFVTTWDILLGIRISLGIVIVGLEVWFWELESELVTLVDGMDD